MLEINSFRRRIGIVLIVKVNIAILLSTGFIWLCVREYKEYKKGLTTVVITKPKDEQDGYVLPSLTICKVNDRTKADKYITNITKLYMELPSVDQLLLNYSISL